MNVNRQKQSNERFLTNAALGVGVKGEITSTTNAPAANKRTSTATVAIRLDTLKPAMYFVGKKYAVARTKDQDAERNVKGI